MLIENLSKRQILVASLSSLYTKHTNVQKVTM